MNVAFIGLGIMGQRMARNLQDEEISLQVYNRNQQVFEDNSKLSWKVRQTPGECVESCEVVFTMLSTESVVDELAFGPSGFATSMPFNSIWVNCTTVSPSFAVSMSEKCSQLGIRYVDAPVAGSRIPAEQGELVFLVGGNDLDIAEITPLLLKMGKKILPVGNVPDGSAVKMLINAMLGQSMILYCEAVQLGRLMGIQDRILFEVLPEFPVLPAYIKSKTKKIRNNDFEVEFPLEWMLKDMRLVDELAKSFNVEMLMGAQTIGKYEKAIREGNGRKDFSAVGELFLE